MIPHRKYTPEDLARMVRRRRWWLIVPLLVVTAGTLIALRFMPDRYRSETLILVVPQRVPESYVKATVTTRIEDRLHSISQQILSRSRLERVITDFDLYRETRQQKPMEDVVEAMRADIRVQMVPGDAFRVSYISDRPQVAMKVAERLASLFIEENLRDREVLAEATNEFLETQLEDARSRLEQQETQLEIYRRTHTGELPSQLQSNMQSVQNMQLQMQALADSIDRERDRRLMLERTMSEAARASAAAARTVPPEAPAVQDTRLQDELRTVAETLQGARLRLRPEHPDVRRLERVVADLTQAIAAQGNTAAASSPAPVENKPAETTPATRDSAALYQAELQNLDSQIEAKERQRRDLQARMALYQARLEAVPTRESELTALTRDYDTLRDVYRQLLSKREESQVAANLERRQIGEQFKILDPPSIPERPFSPNRLRLAAIGTVAALALGLLLVGLQEYRDASLHSEADVAATIGLPIIAVMPIIKTRAQRRRARLRTLTAEAAACAGFAGVIVLAWRTLW